MKAWKKIVATIMVSTICLSGCGGGTQEKKEVKQNENITKEATESVLKFGAQVTDTQLANLSPFATSGTFLEWYKLVYEQLLYFNEVTGELEPALADSYEWNEEKTELTFKLNEKAKWQDGEDFTAEDVIYTYQVLKDNPVFDKYALWNMLTEVVADGENLVFKTKEPFVSLPEYISQIYIVPKHIWEKEDAATFVNGSPIGTGPFIWDEYTTGTAVTFEANKDYWKGAPKVDQAILMMYNSAPNCTLALLKGEIDCTSGTIAMSSLPEFTSKENAKLQTFSGLGNFCVMMNHENEQLADPAVRKAMVMAINQEELISKGEYNGVLPTYITWLPDLFSDNVNKKAAESISYNLEEAQKILENAGYTKGKDGIYEKNGKKLSFNYYSASGAPAQQMEAGMIQQWLKTLGIEITPKLATWAELSELAKTGEYDLLQNNITFPPDPYAALNTTFNSSMTAETGSPTPGTNYFRYRNEEVDALLNKAVSIIDEEELKEVYNEIQAILAEDCVYLPMYNGSGHIPYYDGTRLTGWTDSEAPIFSTDNLINIRPVE
nr:ABC transporter substrate-binding protein [uncultured Blautia sp.]